MKANMKTMMDLLISLQKYEGPLLDVLRKRQLSPVEERVARCQLDLVRDILPVEVLTRYDEMKRTAEDLMEESPELFAMAVLSDTFRGLSLTKRKQLLDFAAEPRFSSSRNGQRRRNCNREQHGSLRGWN
jgi:hypothetical protein